MAPSISDANSRAFSSIRCWIEITLEGAAALAKKLKDWEGGKLVVHITEMPIKCPVAPLEFSFLADDYFRKKGIRDKVDITYVTPLSGAFTKPTCTTALNYLLKEKDIKIEIDFAIESVDNETKEIVDFADRRIPFDLLVTIPTNMGDEVIAKSGLGDRVMIATSSTVEVNQSTPTLETLNTQSPQIYGISPYVLTNPTSNSSGSFSYTSSNTSVATISGDTVTIVGIGSTIITATQEATADYTSASTSSTLQVNKSTPTNPVIINNNGELLYFMGTSSTYANITNNLEINDNLTTLSYKVLTGNNIQIKKTNN